MSTGRRPEIVRHDQLPAWARETLTRLRGANAATLAAHAHFPGGPTNRLRVAFSGLYLAGLAVTIWAILELRADEVGWRWAAGIGLVVVASIAIAISGRSAAPLPNGALLAPEGLVWIEGPRFRVLPRSDIHEARFEDGGPTTRP